VAGQSYRGFAEKVALVTNGARAVGRAVAVSLALEGAFVIVAFDPADEEGESAAAELRELGTLAHAFAADVSRVADVRKLFQSVEETFGRLDLLVNVAPTRGGAGAPDASDETEWDAAIDSALKSTFLCARAAAELMRGRPRPAVVNVASESGLSGRGAGAAEVAAHAGIVGLTKAFAREWGPRVRVNCVAVRPEVGGAAEGAGAAANEVARACLYLLSSDARSVSGQTLVVGGADGP
jgi:NAD(P)-dependent dehydrogenase (short-subunit alcohol dehydrogenase family)